MILYLIQNFSCKYFLINFSEQMGEAEVVSDLSVGGSSDPQEVMDGL